jgi:hypothetical protein
MKKSEEMFLAHLGPAAIVPIIFIAIAIVWLAVKPQLG